MLHHLLRFGAAVGFLVALAAPAPAEEPPPKKEAPPAAAAPADDAHKGDDYRQFFKKPETTEEYWTALQYEIEVGRLDLASGLIHSLVAKPPTEDELLALEEKYGMAAFLTLHTIPKWSDDPKIEEQARKDATQLIDLVREAVAWAEVERPARTDTTLRQEPQRRTRGARLRPQGTLPLRRPGRALHH